MYNTFITSLELIFVTEHGKAKKVLRKTCIILVIILNIDWRLKIVTLNQYG